MLVSLVFSKYCPGCDGWYGMTWAPSKASEGVTRELTTAVFGQCQTVETKGAAAAYKCPNRKANDTKDQDQFKKEGNNEAAQVVYPYFWAGFWPQVDDGASQSSQKLPSFLVP